MRKPRDMPVEYSLDLIDLVCERLADGESLLAISRMPGMPPSGTWYRWMEEHKEARDKYTRAREVQAHVRAEMAVEAGVSAKDAQIGRLAYDALRWHASKLLPKVYGDKMMHTGGDGIGAIELLQKQLVNVSDDALDEIERLLTGAEE